jgi:hypothetical protein
VAKGGGFGQTRDGKAAGVGCLDASFVGHMNVDAVCCGGFVLTRCVQLEKVASATSVGNGGVVLGRMGAVSGRWCRTK